jgi:two-component system cell cycle sensor histidine kinase/response regulator CckA
VIDVEVTGHELHYGGRPARLVMAVDVTERRQLEVQLRQAQKMEAIGRLAGGIAHDFNNTLTAISGYSQLLLDALDEADPRREDVEQVHAAAARAAGLTSQLLAFSRRGMVEAAVHDLNEVVLAVEPMLRQLIGAPIGMDVALRAERPWVVADRSQLEQVLVNLAVNARDAMPDGGMLRIQTDDLDAAAAWAQGSAIGDSVVLTVSDTGVGIAGELREQVFEPFFTTKEAGHGTGLGLATAYSTIRAAGGTIRLASEPGRGAAFRILLPVAAQQPAVAAAAPATPDRVTGSGRILVVEDESAVRTLLGRVLERAGYEVTTASDGGQALQLVDGGDGHFDLVLTDVVMPGMSGIALVRELRSRRPGIRVLLMSGYTEDSVGQGDSRLEMLTKPFSEQDLLARVGASLGAR